MNAAVGSCTNEQKMSINYIIIKNYGIPQGIILEPLLFP